MINLFEKFNFKTQISPYPFYHTGDYLEQTFFNFYLNHIKDFEKLKWNYIPVFWTDLYLSYPHLINDVQQALNSLDSSKRYFTVSQHDDAPNQIFPPNTIHFSAGGNVNNSISIPLICSQIPNTESYVKTKDIFCSFVGSVTQDGPGFAHVAHKVRMSMLESLVNNSNYVLKPKYWSHEIKPERQNLFLEISGRSKYILAPRGYGATSFRMYEAMQLKAVPVYIYDVKQHLPYKNILDWNRLAVIINYKDITNIDNILHNISDDLYKDMLKYIEEIYPEYFVLEKLGPNILRVLKTLQ